MLNFIIMLCSMKHSVKLYVIGEWIFAQLKAELDLVLWAVLARDSGEVVRKSIILHEPWHSFGLRIRVELTKHALFKLFFCLINRKSASFYTTFECRHHACPSFVFFHNLFWSNLLVRLFWNSSWLLIKWRFILQCCWTSLNHHVLILEQIFIFILILY
jgi:hypothetical protein